MIHFVSYYCLMQLNVFTSVGSNLRFSNFCRSLEWSQRQSTIPFFQTLLFSKEHMSFLFLQLSVMECFRHIVLPHFFSMPYLKRSSWPHSIFQYMFFISTCFSSVSYNKLRCIFLEFFSRIFHIHDVRSLKIKTCSPPCRIIIVFSNWVRYILIFHKS